MTPDRNPDAGQHAILRLARRIPPLPGGQEQHVARLAEEQSIRGAGNVVVFSEGAPQPASKCRWVKIPAFGGVPSDFARGLLFSAAAVSSRRVRAFAHQAQAIHSHGTAGDIYATVMLKSSSTRAFHSFHASLAIPPHVRASFYALLPRLDGIFVVSDVIREQLLALEIRLPPIYTLSSAVDPQFFALAINDNPTHALMIGRLVRYKGFDIGIRAASSLYKRGLITGIDIAGGGPEETALRRVAEAEQVPVRFHGHIGKDDVARLLSNSAVLLCPSKTVPGQAEGSPTAILEAWAARVPVVASGSGGIPHLIQNGVNGVLVPEGDVERLAAGAQQAMELRSSLTKEGRARINGHTWQRLAALILDAYRERGAKL